MHEPALPQPLLDEPALDALRRTRPWLYLLGVLSALGVALGLIMLLAGFIGLGINSARSAYVIGAGVGLLVVTIPSAITQLGYAMSLSRVEEAPPGELPAAVETACRRQRNLWVVNAFTVGLLVIITLLQLILAALSL